MTIKEQEKILSLIIKSDPSTWWVEYPPKITYLQNRLDKKKILGAIKNIFYKNQWPIGVYINIPFCKKRCYFCKYYSETNISGNVISNYLKCLDKELSLYNIDFKSIVLDNVYIGGGTPSLLNLKETQKLFKIINSYFNTNKTTQIIYEGTPETITLKKAILLKENGVNRLTIGVQTFDEKLLKKINRGHGIKEIYKSYEAAKRAGIKNINLDLLLGIPGELELGYRKMAENLIKMSPECISFHTMVPGKRLLFNNNEINQSLSRGRMLIKKIFPEIKKKLLKVGYIEADGFSGVTFIKKKCLDAVNRGLINRYKLNPVLGVGSNSGSWMMPIKYAISCQVKDYIRAVSCGNLPDFSGMSLSKDEVIRRYLIHSFVLWKELNKKDFFSHFKKDVLKVLKRDFSDLISNNLVRKNNKHLSLSRKWKSEFQGNLTNKYNDLELICLFCIKYIFSEKVINAIKKSL